MAELRLTLDLRLPPDPAVIAPLWAAAGIKHSPPEVCRMLLLAQLAAPLDESGWQGAAVIVGAALEAVAPEHDAEAAEAEAAESVAYAEMAAAFDRPAPPGGAIRNEATSTTIDPGPILIEDDDDPNSELPPSQETTEGVATREGNEQPEASASQEAAATGVASPRCSGSEGADDRPQQSLQAKSDLPPAVEVSETAEGGGVVPAPEPVAEVVQPVEPEAASVEPVAEVAPAAEPMVAAAVESEDEGQPPAAEVWTARRDLQLVAAMTGGQGALQTSRKMGLSREECVRRFKELLPRPGAMAQQALVKRLRAQVEAEGSEP